MKMRNRIISFALALFVLVSAFAACDSDSTESTTEAETKQNANATEGEAIVTASTDSESETISEAEVISETETDYSPDIEKKDYGATFHIYIQGDANKPYYHWVEESSGDALSESIYARQEKVYSHLGVEIVGSDAGSYQTYTEAFQTSIKNKDDSIQLMLSHVHQGIEGLVTGNYLRDFRSIDEINLDSNYWNMNFMNDLALNDHMFLGNSDFNILYTHVIAFNKIMMDQYGDLESDVYTLVKDGKWTLDTMIGLASTVYVDTTANGKTEDDTFGITGVQWVPFIGFLHASDLNYIDMNEAGNYEVAVYNKLNQEKTAALIEKLSAMVASDYAWFRYRVENTPLVQLQSGRTLMTLISTNDLPNLCNYDIEFGILPYPMYDESQKEVGYRHLQWGGYLCVPSYSADPVMVGETLELLSYYSEDVNVTFYEKLLGKQVADVPLDRQMLDLVWNTICSEFGQAYTAASGSWLYMLPELTWVNATQNLASYVSANINSSNKKINKFMKEINRLDQVRLLH